MKQLRFLITFIVLLVAMQGFSQAIVGGAGVIAVSGDPDNITALQSQDIRYEGLIAVDTTNGDQYTYDNSAVSGSRWNISNSGGESTTVTDSDNIDLTLSGVDITADVVIDGAAGNRLTTSASGLFVAAEVDGDITNELQTLDVTSNATSVTATLSDGGGAQIFEEGDGIDLSTTGTTTTITSSEASQGAYDNHADAASNSVLIGEYYYASTTNTMGAVPGTKIRRMF